MLAFLMLPPTALAIFVLVIDPYFVFGAPSWPGINTVRPYYEPHVVIAKPYQVARVRPAAIALGSSRVEVGIDPRHEGWTSGAVFNFGLPSANSYTVMLAFLHAQKHGAPLKQAVVGLDFFAYNINFPLTLSFSEQRFHGAVVEEFAQYLDDVLGERNLHDRITNHAAPPQEESWDEALYLAVNADVAAAVHRKDFKSGREHFELAGRAERRKGTSVPPDWDEAGYLQVHPDVAAAVANGAFINGYHHWLAAGRAEGRLGGFKPAGWDEERYLTANPFARIRIAFGHYRNGYLHYVATGRQQGLAGAVAPASLIDHLLLQHRSLRQVIFYGDELFRLAFSPTALRHAISTLLRQAEPTDFDSRGMRVWDGQEAVVSRIGGPGRLMRTRLITGPWAPMLLPPTHQYCFGNPVTGMTTFEPYRFMIRKAYAEGTDLRLFVTPLHAAVHVRINALGLGERYAFWLKELVRLNEEEAAIAGRPPFPLWDFSDTNSITTEPIPDASDPSPMRWYWEHSHYRKETGDLMLDRIFEHNDAGRPLPVDFGVRLTTATIDSHLVRAKASLAAWAAQSNLAADILREASKPSPLNRQAEAKCW